ncbi:MAG: ABC transporter substrate-binding protein [Bacteroidetes bacterium]|nr:MAG: ABC transporter substrate-binding protein [Bacteroidota bacterium]
MKVCSFLPAVTQMIYDMGLDEYLGGVTFECHKAALAEKPVVVRCKLEGHDYSSEEIDKIFSASKAQGNSLYYVDEELLSTIAPDLILTQDVCEVCQIDTACTAAAVARLKKQPTLISISPGNLEDVFKSAITIAKAIGREENAYEYLSKLQKRLDLIIDRLRMYKAPLKKVMVMEWMQPVYNCGHWIPYQIAHAGGVDMLSNPGGDSIVTSWEKILKYNPEVLVIAPCGFDIHRSALEINLLEQQAGWTELRAVKEDNVFFADFDLFTQPSAGTLVDGIDLLAALFHPEIFEVPKHLERKSKKMQSSVMVIE